MEKAGIPKHFFGHPGRQKKKRKIPFALAVDDLGEGMWEDGNRWPRKESCGWNQWLQRPRFSKNWSAPTKKIKMQVVNKIKGFKK